MTQVIFEIQMYKKIEMTLLEGETIEEARIRLIDNMASLEDFDLDDMIATSVVSEGKVI